MNDPRVIRAFSNIGQVSAGRKFPGFPDHRVSLEHRVSARGATKIRMLPGDLVSVSAAIGKPVPTVLAFDDRGEDALSQLGLVGDTALSIEDFDSGAILGWMAQHGGGTVLPKAAVLSVTDPIVLKTTASCDMWMICPAARCAVVEGDIPGEVLVSVSRPRDSFERLPEPLGEVRDEFTVSRGTAQAYELQKGEFVQIIDVEGQQCSDFQAFLTAPLEAGREFMIDSTATRSMVRHAYPAPGLLDKFFDSDLRPMFRVVQDTCGRHDTFGLACTARGYEERGFPGHVNCSDNISDAVEGFGVARRGAWPAINFFWNTWIDPHDHRLLTEESYSRPGDYVAMQALENMVCVSTACPDDVDPINGWNPTDVHVRIYREKTSIRRAVAYRVKEDAPMSISKESAFHARTSALTNDFAPARDLWTPTSFPGVGTIGEYWACREKATVQDMSGLRKYDVVGPDAERLLQLAMTRDVSRLAVWRGTYALMCDQTGAVIDDGTLFRMAPDIFRWCCGTEESIRVFESLAQKNALNVRLHDLSDGLVNLALQGPKSREVLEGLVFTQPQVPPLEHLKWFGATVARLHDREGAPFMLTRTGYTGELGFELFCAPADATAVWDALMNQGADLGIAPMGNAALDVIRIEAGLAAAGAEFAPGTDAFEAGLGFAVDLKKSDFVGKPALERNAQDPRRILRGLMFDCNDLPTHGAPVFAGERQICQITSATRSPMFECSIAMARLAVEHAEIGTELEVGMMDGRMKRLACKVTTIPFFDPKRERARA